LGFAPDDDLTARAAVLMDAATGKVIYQKEPDLHLPPASTTKVITAIVTLESGRKLSERLTVSKEATRVPATKLYLRPGQTITIDDLLYAALLSSANDASVVLAEGISGSIDSFSELMTRKAKEIGAINSNFTNPHGLTAPEHYSTAKDLALIFRYAMNNATFREIVQTKISSVTSTTVVRKKNVLRRISVRNHNRLLWNFEGAIGGKTGYTAAAQKCFVGAVQRNGTTLIVAILGSRDQWGDTRRLLEYGFENFQALKAGLPIMPRSMNERVHVSAENFPSLTLAPREASAASDLTESYVLQVGSFQESGRAEALSKQFTDRGFRTFIEKIPTDKNQFSYRVRVGPYAQRARAQEAAQELIKSGYQAVILALPAPESTGNSG